MQRQGAAILQRRTSGWKGAALARLARFGRHQVVWSPGRLVARSSRRQVAIPAAQPDRCGQRQAARQPGSCWRRRPTSRAP